MFEEALASWDGEEVVIRHDGPTGAWMLVGVHSTALGPAFGGTRMRVYDSPTDAMRDVLRLSSAMTSKNALAGLPFGGGKAVLAVPEIPSGSGRRRLLERYGDVVASLGGTYRTACDMNTVESDMDVVATRAEGFVFGRSASGGGSGSAGLSTALGVFHGILAAAGHVLGSSELSGRRVLVQGVGEVGEPLATMLAVAGASVTVADVDAERARDLADRLRGRVVEPSAALQAECDVLAPCAVGAVLNARTIPGLLCRLIAGAANNQLGEPEDAERLREAGIVYVPDYAVNAGGVLHLAGLEALGWSQGQLEDRLRVIGDTVADVLGRAESRGISTESAAAAMVAERLVSAGSS